MHVATLPDNPDAAIFLLTLVTVLVVTAMTCVPVAIWIWRRSRERAKIERPAERATTRYRQRKAALVCLAIGSGVGFGGILAAMIMSFIGRPNTQFFYVALMAIPMTGAALVLHVGSVAIEKYGEF